MNDGISLSFSSLLYAFVGIAVDIIMRLGQSTELVKLDLSNANRMVPVHPDNQPLLDISWQGNTYIERALPIGLRSGPKIFNAVADFLARVLYCHGVSTLIHYLDDFLLVESPGSNRAAVSRVG